MRELKNVRHDRFCQGVVSGLSHSEAYRQAGYGQKDVDGNAARLIVKDSIASRIAEIRAENAAKCEMSKEEYRRYLIGAMRTPAADIGPHHQFCQVYKETDSEGLTREWKTPDKLRAAQLLAQHCGWDEPTKIALEAGDSLTEFLKQVVTK